MNSGNSQCRFFKPSACIMNSIYCAIVISLFNNCSHQVMHWSDTEKPSISTDAIEFLIAFSFVTKAIHLSLVK